MNPNRVMILAGAVASIALFLAGCSPKSSTVAAPTSGVKPATEAAAASAASPAANAPDYQSVTGAKVTFQWKVDGQNLDCILSAPTTGWVGVGFGTTGQMKGSEIFLGYVQDGKATIRDEFGDAINHHSPVSALGEQSIIANASGTQKDGVTELHFSIRLDATGRYHVPLVAGKKYLLLLAHAPEGAADTSTYHGPGNRTVVQITL